jgi:hypothetical protein
VISLPAGFAAVGETAGMLILYGVGRNAPNRGRCSYTRAVGLLAPLLGGGLA